MELHRMLPEKEGQICRLINPMEDENPLDVYIIAEDPSPFGVDENIYVVRLNDLQRNLSAPELTPQIAVTKKDLMVVASDIEQYVGSWNN